MADEEKRDDSVPRLNKTDVDPANNTRPGQLDASVIELITQSDSGYRNITNRIIDISHNSLTSLIGNKKPLRWLLLGFIIVLLSAQFIILCIILFSNHKLGISDFIINTYILSVFVETLAGLIIMIKFCFNSQEETKLIEILNSAVAHFQKYEGK